MGSEGHVKVQFAALRPGSAESSGLLILVDAETLSTKQIEHRPYRTARWQNKFQMFRQLKTLKVMFLGAGKRLSLLERFQVAASIEGIAVNMYSVEWTRREPIATIASVIEGPSFDTEECGQFLLDVARQFEIDIIIPNTDPAVIALSKLKSRMAESGIWAVISNPDLCASMYDKTVADSWFRRYGLAVPNGNNYPLVVKYRLGSGGRDQFLANHEDEFRAFISHRNAEDYFIQSYVHGQEYTVDAYVTRSGRTLGSLSRKRIVVVGGEVNVSETFRHEGILNATARVLSVEGWEGPITLQFIDGPHGPVLIEVNPRFGGGVTHSIHCGLDMPRWILRECLELPVDPAPEWPDESFMTRCRRDIFYDDFG